MRLENHSLYDQMAEDLIASVKDFINKLDDDYGFNPAVEKVPSNRKFEWSLETFPNHSGAVIASVALPVDHEILMKLEDFGVSNEITRMYDQAIIKGKAKCLEMFIYNHGLGDLAEKSKMMKPVLEKIYDLEQFDELHDGKQIDKIAGALKAWIKHHVEHGDDLAEQVDECLDDRWILGSETPHVYFGFQIDNEQKDKPFHIFSSIAFDDLSYQNGVGILLDGVKAFDTNLNYILCDHVMEIPDNMQKFQDGLDFVMKETCPNLEKKETPKP